MTAQSLIVRWLGRLDYVSCWKAMQEFTNHRHDETLDEIWLLEHDPVFTQGQNGKAEHVLNPGIIPVIQTDRGGQVTYHGPGQLMIYTLLDIRRKQLNIRQYVTLLEQSVIDLLAEFGISAAAKREAPGVYVDGKKIASIGLRIRRGFAYHGIAFNISMDLEPFRRINPCGFSALEMTQFAALGGPDSTLEAGNKLVNYLRKNLVYTHATFYNLPGVSESEIPGTHLEHTDGYQNNSQDRC
ncbi:Octanoyltransferase [Aquicella siphonis]|uniref:Octanoyltransferase n=1 Tax=Aquicella siphonis TaxID=254247 RepID=A0A5E4PJN2_9COXI|nr:lipoyl(octanoyl) transferase LipB [Aquicella siphonis]VVC76506.1 Octanoyltransferase [Aquicella siphonis]